MNQQLPFSPMREQLDDNIIAEYRNLRLHNLNPKIAIAIADVIKKCADESSERS